MPEEKSVLCEQLDSTDTSILFLVLLVFSVLLSLWSVTIQRRCLCDAIRGKTTPCPSVFPIRLAASAMVVGSLSFFLCLAVRSFCQALAGTDAVACRSARINLAASILVLAAALLRLDDLVFVERSGEGPALEEEDTLPE